ncbi:MAG TPA: DUF222 domain-containing protein [Actinomycetota bacterium]|nr:DUF222 domain-containing protein [Actinomycetota bacterium]
MYLKGGIELQERGLASQALAPTNAYTDPHTRTHTRSRLASDFLHSAPDPDMLRERERRIAKLKGSRAAAGRAQFEMLADLSDCDDPFIWGELSVDGTEVIDPDEYDGARDMPGWVAAQFGITKWAAGRWLFAAHALKRLPCTSEAFSSGELSFDKMLDLVRIATPDNEEKLLRWAYGSTVSAVRKRADRENQPPKEEAAEAIHDRYLRHWYELDGQMGFAGRMPADQGQVIANALDRIARDVIPVLPGEEEPGWFDPGDGLDRRRADALYLMALSGLSGFATAGSGSYAHQNPDSGAQPAASCCHDHGSPAQGSMLLEEPDSVAESSGFSSAVLGASDTNGEDPQGAAARKVLKRAAEADLSRRSGTEIVVHAPLEAFSSDTIGGETEGGGVIHPETLRRLSCDARIQLALENGEGQPVGVGHSRYSPPGYVRRAVYHRDGRCAFPGCHGCRFMDCHHIVHWPTGPTQTDNLIMVCPFHHKLLHELAWNVELNVRTGETRWFRPDGSLLEVPGARSTRAGPD